MIYDEEIQARKLYETLTIEILDSIDGSEISIDGIGVHWHCITRLKERTCRIDCLGSSGYAISFNLHDATEANGRTNSEEKVMSATITWLQSGNLEKLYKLFEFVDYDKRSLLRVIDAFTNQYPECIQEVKIGLNQNFSGNFDLKIEAKDRFCKIYLRGETPTYDFYWDDCMLFSCLEKNSESLLLIKLWLYDYYMPSQLEKKFEWLDIGELAKYYEKGQGIEGEFILSWDRIEKFYRTPYSFIQNPEEILKMIAELRSKGYDKTLRAGQSMDRFIVSRARKHGFMKNYIAFYFFNKEMKVTAKFNSEEILSFPDIKLNPKVEELIKQLEAKDLDLPPKY